MGEAPVIGPGSDDGALERKPVNDGGAEPEPEEGVDDAHEGGRILGHVLTKLESGTLDHIAAEYDYVVLAGIGSATSGRRAWPDWAAPGPRRARVLTTG